MGMNLASRRIPPLLPGPVIAMSGMLSLKATSIKNTSVPGVAGCVCVKSDVQECQWLLKLHAFGLQFFPARSRDAGSKECLQKKPRPFADA
jgi:hypothetical protein